MRGMVPTVVDGASISVGTVSSDLYNYFFESYFPPVLSTELHVPTQSPPEGSGCCSLEGEMHPPGLESVGGDIPSGKL